ncbi:MAG: hypothetical protein R3D71_05735 [Rickettsiales bacterium]
MADNKPVIRTVNENIINVTNPESRINQDVPVTITPNGDKHIIISGSGLQNFDVDKQAIDDHDRAAAIVVLNKDNQQKAIAIGEYNNSRDKITISHIQYNDGSLEELKKPSVTEALVGLLTQEPPKNERGTVGVNRTTGTLLREGDNGANSLGTVEGLNQFINHKIEQHEQNKNNARAAADSVEVLSKLASTDAAIVTSQPYQVAAKTSQENQLG